MKKMAKIKLKAAQLSLIGAIEELKLSGEKSASPDKEYLEGVSQALIQIVSEIEFLLTSIGL